MKEEIVNLKERKEGCKRDFGGRRKGKWCHFIISKIKGVIFFSCKGWDYDPLCKELPVQQKDLSSDI